MDTLSRSRSVDIGAGSTPRMIDGVLERLGELALLHLLLDLVGDLLDVGLRELRDIAEVARVLPHERLVRAQPGRDESLVQVRHCT